MDLLPPLPPICAEVVESKDHQDFEQFMAAVQVRAACACALHVVVAVRTGRVHQGPGHCIGRGPKRNMLRMSCCLDACAMQALWDDTWAKVHAASPEGGREPFASCAVSHGALL